MAIPVLLLAAGPSWIEGVRLARLGPVDYRLTISARNTRPYTRRFVSNDPPTVSQVNDDGLGPAVIVQGFDPQADSLFAVSCSKGQWIASETIYARYGIVVRHSRAGEMLIEAQVRNDRWPEEKGQPEWIAERYVLRQGELRRAAPQRFTKASRVTSSALTVSATGNSRQGPTRTLRRSQPRSTPTL